MWLSCQSVVLSLGVFCGTVVGGGESVDFARDIAPLLAESCVDCHGADQQNGGLRLDAAISSQWATDSGIAAIVPGDPASSGLLMRVSSPSDEDRMPPDGEPLSHQEIELLTQWIAEGAIGLSNIEVTPAKRILSDHWSFQPLSSSNAEGSDAVSEGAEVDSNGYNSIDAYISRQRQRLGLSVAPPAEAVTLVRRLTYDLTGLPPTPQEVQRFQTAVQQSGDLSQVARRWIDECLSRPQYGERWGRHWMDWVRYADTAGDNSDFPIPEAYLYRNYLINCFNDDVPYDQFLIEQLAGDLLPSSTIEQRNRQTIATGYLAMARRFGSLVERYPWHLTIEDTIDNVGRSMMGLTLSCARCHDHKFDPISARDYYGLYGFFASTRYPFPGIELFQVPHHFVPLLEPKALEKIQQPYERKTGELETKLDQLLDQCHLLAIEHAADEKEATIDQQREMREKLDALLIKARQAGTKLADHLRTLPEIPSAYAVSDAESIDARLQIKGEPDRPGAIVPRKFPDVLGGYLLPENVTGSGRLELARWIASPDNPLTARVIVNRIWQRHFGRGLVASTSDFGLRGEIPTHPGLLDHLALEFMRHGWSIKWLHRIILNSQTYQLSSTDLPENFDRDPDNHFLWKFNRYRLDAESIRDTLLFVSGRLDTTPALEPHPFPPRRDWDFTQHYPFNDSYTNDRRSVYQMIKRLTADPTLQTFDGPDPNVCTSQRDQSITALQALYFVNDEFLHEQAEDLARRVLTIHADDVARLEMLTLTLFGRTPDEWEMSAFPAYLSANRQPEDNSAAWISLTRSLMRANEFIYVD